MTIEQISAIREAAGRWRTVPDVKGLNPTGTFRSFRELADLAGEGITLRWYRRTGATVIARGASADAAATFLGHGSTAITEGHYIEPDRNVDRGPPGILERTLRRVDPDTSPVATVDIDRIVKG